jgi:hypothetical protein
MSEIIPEWEELTIEEIDEKLGEAVARHEISECQICLLLFEMRKRRGYEEFGFSSTLRPRPRGLKRQPRLRVDRRL